MEVRYLLIVFFLMGCTPMCRQIQCDKSEEEKVRDFMRECLLGASTSWDCSEKAKYVFDCKETIKTCEDANNIYLVFVDAENKN